jgi:Ice-binding-like
MAWPTACELDSRTGRVATGSETDSATTTPAERDIDNGAGGVGADQALGAGVQLFVGGSAGSGSAGSAGNDDGSADETAAGAGSAGSAAAGAGSAASAAAGAGSAGSAAAGSSNGTAMPGTPDDPSDPPGTGAGVGPAPVFLGEAGTYAILAQSAITNIPFSAITGNLGISPAAASSITGFPLTRVGTLWLAPEVVGEVFAADNDPPTPSDLIDAISDMQAAYDDAAGRTTPEFTNLGAGNIGGLTLAPGLYKWASVVSIPSDVTISGAANDVWIFQITGDLTLASGTSMILSGGAQAKNIVWQVAGFVELGTTSHAEGTMLSKTAIHLRTGASIDGRLLAQTAVTLDMVTITEPPP